MGCVGAVARLIRNVLVAQTKDVFLRAAIALFTLLIGPAVASGQVSGGNYTGSVEGRVICNDGGFPARSAIVDLIPLANLLGETKDANTSDPAKVAMAATDFDGNYSIHTLAAGDYLAIGKLSGYSVDFALILARLKQFPLDRQKELLTGFPHVTVQAGSVARQDVVIRRGGAISGRVTFDSGGSLHDTMVRAVMISSSLFGDEPGEALKPIDLPYMKGMTDDRGDYRIAGLSAGKYRIYTIINHHGAATPSGPVTVYAPESMTEAKSQVIEVGEGDEISDVDISIPLRRLHSIGGTVTRDGVPVEKGFLTIQRQDSAGESDVPIQPDGSYRINLVSSGTYIIGTQDFYAKKEKPGSLGNNTITIQLGDRDVLDANLDLLGRAPAE